MIPYKVVQFAPNRTHFTTGVVRYVAGRDYFGAVPFEKNDKFVIPPPPNSLKDSREHIRVS